MSKNTVVDFSRRVEAADPLSDLLRREARVIAAGRGGELATFLEHYVDCRLEYGRSAVVRNGHLPGQDIQTGIGPVTVKVPKVRSKGGKPGTLRSALVLPYDAHTGSCAPVAAPERRV